MARTPRGRFILRFRSCIKASRLRYRWLEMQTSVPPKLISPFRYNFTFVAAGDCKVAAEKRFPRGRDDRPLLPFSESLETQSPGRLPCKDFCIFSMSSLASCSSVPTTRPQSTRTGTWVSVRRSTCVCQVWMSLIAYTDFATA